MLRYVGECKDGKSGPREKDFNMRWIASMVADVHRIMMRGGVFMYPKDSRPNVAEGRLRQLYEACPMAFLIEQAGGAASTGYHAEYDAGEDQPYTSPLFNDRSLYSGEI